MRIALTSILVDDQEKALAFYTEVLGSVKKTEIPLGEARWLTVVSPEEPEGTEGGITMAVLDDTCGNLVQSSSALTAPGSG